MLVLTGDPFQLEPVKGHPLAKGRRTSDPDSVNQERGSSNEVRRLASDAGAEIYRGIDRVVQLVQGHRFASDPPYGHAMTEVRIGAVSDKSEELLASCAANERTAPIDRGRPLVITSKNEDRHKYNIDFLRVAGEEAAAKGIKVFRVAADVIRKGVALGGRRVRDRQPLDEDVLAKVRQLDSKKTGDISTILYLYHGMPVRITANQGVMAGIANGAMGTVFHVEFDEDTEFRTAIDPDLQCSVVYPNKAPVNIYVQMDGLSETDAPKWAGLPDCWPRNVYPVACQGASFSFQYARCDSGVVIRPRSGRIPKSQADLKFTVVDAEIHGFPLVPAFALTAHGVQGLTLDNIYVTKLDKVRGGGQALYVALSRVRTSAGLTTEERLTKTILDQFKPSKATLEASRDSEQRAVETEQWLTKLGTIVKKAFDAMECTE